jgi:repressor LexA
MGAESGETVGDLIRARRGARRVTLAKLAEEVGCAKSYLSLIEHNRRGAPSEEILGKIEAALGFERGRLVGVAVRRRLARVLRGSVDEAYRTGELRKLVEAMGISEPAGSTRTGGTPVPLVLPAQVPLINKVAAGYPADFTDLGFPARVADEYVRAPDVGDPDAFAARVVGDSMMPEYREGDVVVFSPAREVKSGMDCYARLEPDHQSTFKRVYFEEGGEGEAIRLQPLNAAYPARTVSREQVAGLYAAVSVTRTL